MVCDTLNKDELSGILRLSYARGAQPRMVVSLMLHDGSLEELLTVTFSDLSESPVIGACRSATGSPRSRRCSTRFAVRRAWRQRAELPHKEPMGQRLRQATCESRPRTWTAPLRGADAPEQSEEMRFSTDSIGVSCNNFVLATWNSGRFFRKFGAQRNGIW